MRVTLSSASPATNQSIITADQKKTSSPRQTATIKIADQKTFSAEQNTTSTVVADQKKISLQERNTISEEATDEKEVLAMAVGQQKIVTHQKETSLPEQSVTTTTGALGEQMKAPLLKHRPANVSYWPYVPVAYACLHLYHTIVRPLLM